eukprot:GHVU01015851.1.p1 GENE.GHVU01015851.1~~GHVU01015851.1.p1  ORF type:complete len:114 (-),score=1.26 GHVU01015851.1:65-406(-)
MNHKTHNAKSYSRIQTAVQSCIRMSVVPHTPSWFIISAAPHSLIMHSIILPPTLRSHSLRFWRPVSPSALLAAVGLVVPLVAASIRSLSRQRRPGANTHGQDDNLTRTCVDDS